MSKFIDLAGKRFGKLTVLYRHHQDYISNQGYKQPRWVCKCDCGNEKTVISSALKSKTTRSRTVSCGCYHREITKLKNTKDLAGKRFGKWTVIYQTDSHHFPGGAKENRYMCLCSCGNKKSLLGSSLVAGTSKSCGCYKKQSKNFKDMTGFEFGNLKVTRRGKDYHRPLSNISQITWECLCSCGKTFTTLGRSLRSGSVRSCGCSGKESNIAKDLKRYCIENYKAIPEHKILKNPKTGRWLPYDIYIPCFRIFIEVNGAQHYKKDGFFFKTEKEFTSRKLIDKYKKDFAERYGTYIEIDLRKIKTAKEAIAYIEERI